MMKVSVVVLVNIFHGGQEMYSLLHRCFIDSAIFSSIFSKKPVFRGLNMENLLHRCLIEKAKNERIIQAKPLKSSFEEKNCLTVV